MFKIKPKKEEAPIMVDTKHQEYIERFRHDDEIIIPKLKEDMDQCKMLNKLDKVKLLEQRVNAIQQEHLQYYLNNNIHIFAYFEEKKNISDCKLEKKVLLNKFFNLDKSTNTVQKLNTHDIQYLTNIQENYINTDQYIYDVSICKKCNKGELIQVDFEG